MTPKKGRKDTTAIGINFTAVTRAKLNLIAAGLDRPIGWVVRDFVGAGLNGVEFQDEFKDYCKRFPKLAAALDQAIKDAGGDFDEMYGSTADVTPDTKGEEPVS